MLPPSTLLQTARRGFLRTPSLSGPPLPPPPLIRLRGQRQGPADFPHVAAPWGAPHGGRGTVSRPHAFWVTFSPWPWTYLSPSLKWGWRGASIWSLCSTLSSSPQGPVILNGLLGWGQALWECRELRLIRGRERRVQQAALPPSSLLPLPCQCSGSGRRAEGS